MSGKNIRAQNNWPLMVILCMLTVTICMGQDPSFSQYKFNKLFFNPAYAGYNEQHHIVVGYRTLWPNVPGRPFAGPLANYQVAADFFFREGQGSRSKTAFTGGAGLFCAQDFEGEGQLITSIVGATFAQHFPVIQNAAELPRLLFAFGLKGYAVNTRVNWDKLVSSDQLDINLGVVGSSANGRTGIGRRWGGDLDFGMLVINNFKGKSNWYNEIGFSAAHLVRSSVALSRSNEPGTRVPIKFGGSYRTKFVVVQKQLYMGLTMLFQNQAKFYDLNTAFDIYLGLGKKDATPLIITLAHRTSVSQIKKNTKAFVAGLGHEGYISKSRSTILYYIGFAADIPYDGLSFQSMGAYEISLGISIPKRKQGERTDCATF